MEAFFIRVLTAVLNNPQIQAMLKQAFADALAEVKTDLVVEIEKLPGEILGDATKDVGTLLHEITGTTDDIAAAVHTNITPLFSGLGIDTNSLAQQLIAAIKAAIPFPFNR